MSATKQTMTFLKDSRDRTDDKDFLLGKEQLLARASGGEAEINVSAQLLVGMGYHQGRFGFPVDLAEAEKWLGMAMKEEHLDPGSCALAYCFEHGLAGKPKDIGRAKGEYLSAQKKCLAAKYLSASIFHKDPFQDDEQKEPLTPEFIANDLLKNLMECVDQGFVPAIAFLGMRYLTDGWFVSVDRERGLKLLKSAAEQGDGSSRFFLGQLYSQGLHGVNQDLTEAKKWYKLAQEQRYPGADQALQSPKKGCVIV